MRYLQIKNSLKAWSGVLILLLCLPVWGQNVKGDFQGCKVYPKKPLALLAEASLEGCAICVQQLHTESFELLDSFFIPGVIFRIGPACCPDSQETGGQEILINSPDHYRDRKALDDSMEQLRPTIGFKFHTEKHHLVGITPADYTSDHLLELISNPKQGKTRAIELEIIPYAYGDGRAFNYYTGRNHLQVHCRILRILPE